MKNSAGANDLQSPPPKKNLNIWWSLFKLLRADMRQHIVSISQPPRIECCRRCQVVTVMVHSFQNRLQSKLWENYWWGYSIELWYNTVINYATYTYYIIFNLLFGSLVCRMMICSPVHKVLHLKATTSHRREVATDGPVNGRHTVTPHTVMVWGLIFPK